jgi:hypothetical protein
MLVTDPYMAYVIQDIHAESRPLATIGLCPVADCSTGCVQYEVKVRASNVEVRVFDQAAEAFVTKRAV